MTTIGKRGRAPSAPAPDTSPVRSWKVQVDPSLLAHVPPLILHAWLCVEAYVRARPSSSCWPDNATLAKQMGLEGVNRVQERLLALEDLGVVERQARDGNRRVIVLKRRAHEPLTPSAWSAAVAAADQRRAERANTKCKRRPTLKIVSPDDLSSACANPPGFPGDHPLPSCDHPPGFPGDHPPGFPGAMGRRRRVLKKTKQQQAAG